MEPERRAELRRMPYAEYLLTREWKETCAKALQRAGYRCQVCNANGPLNVCRNTYERLGCELPSDLVVLCEQCLAIAVVRAPLLAQAATPTSSIDLRKPGLSFQQVQALYDAGRLTDQQFYALLSQVTHLDEESEAVTVTGNRRLQDPCKSLENAQIDTKMEDFDRRNGYGNGNEDEYEAASEQAVSPQNEPLRPPRWDSAKIQQLAGAFLATNHLDNSLKAIGLSTSQRNRDFARELLKQQELWKEK